jgi:hypothetical protein
LLIEEEKQKRLKIHIKCLKRVVTKRLQIFERASGTQSFANAGRWASSSYLCAGVLTVSAHHWTLCTAIETLSESFNRSTKMPLSLGLGSFEFEVDSLSSEI